MRQRLIRTSIMILPSALLLPGEQAFEVVSIHEVPRNAPPLMRSPNEMAIRPGGQFVDPRIDLQVMIMIAF